MTFGLVFCATVVGGNGGGFGGSGGSGGPDVGGFGGGGGPVDTDGFTSLITFLTGVSGNFGIILSLALK